LRRPGLPATTASTWLHPGHFRSGILVEAGQRSAGESGPHVSMCPGSDYGDSEDATVTVKQGSSSTRVSKSRVASHTWLVQYRTLSRFAKNVSARVDKLTKMTKKWRSVAGEAVGECVLREVAAGVLILHPAFFLS